MNTNEKIISEEILENVIGGFMSGKHREPLLPQCGEKEETTKGR